MTSHPNPNWYSFHMDRVAHDAQQREDLRSPLGGDGSNGDAEDESAGDGREDRDSISAPVSDLL